MPVGVTRSGQPGRVTRRASEEGELNRNQKAAARQLSLAAYLLASDLPKDESDLRENLPPYADVYDSSLGYPGASGEPEDVLRERAADALRKQLSRDVEALGVAGIRVEVSGEARGRLYRLTRSGFSPVELDLSLEERAVLVGALRALRRDFPYSGPLRLAVANMIGALSPEETGDEATALAAIATREDEEVASRVATLESAVLRRKRVRFVYYSITRDATASREVEPYTLSLLDGVWYVAGRDVSAGEVRQFRLSRIEGRVGFATHREGGDFTVPEDFDHESAGPRVPWQLGESNRTARLLLDSGIAREADPRAGEVEGLPDGASVFVTPYSGERQLAGWTLSLGEGAVALAPESLKDRIVAGLRKIESGHGGES